MSSRANERAFEEHMSHLRANSVSEYAQRQAVNTRIDIVFSEAARKRREREEFVRDPDDNMLVPGWILYEREQMKAAVNAERAKLGKGEVDPKKLLRVEHAAMGHVDYQRKFVLYCTELVFDDWRGP